VTKSGMAACRKSAIVEVYRNVAKIRGVSVDVIVSRFRAGESIEGLSNDYQISEEDITHAIRCGAR